MYIYSFMKLNLWNISNIFSYIISKCILINLHYLWQVYWLMRLSALKKLKIFWGKQRIYQEYCNLLFVLCKKVFLPNILKDINDIHTYIYYVCVSYLQEKKKSITCQLKCSNVSLKFFYSKQSKLKVSN